MYKKILIPIIFLLLASITHSENIITGKVISISDGDTVSVLQNNTQYKIRLYGIDTPEKGKAFGRRAKEYISGLVFNKTVSVIQKDIDRYGRIVGLILVGNVCVNEEIIRAGYAWVYKQYCRDDFCQNWIKIERQARESLIGIWSHPDPMPPWEYRQRGKTSFKNGNKPVNAKAF